MQTRCGSASIAALTRTAFKKEVRHLGRKIDVFGDDLMRTRVDVRDLEARVTALEQKPA